MRARRQREGQCSGIKDIEKRVAGFFNRIQFCFVFSKWVIQIPMFFQGTSIDVMSSNSDHWSFGCRMVGYGSDAKTTKANTDIDQYKHRSSTI